MTNEEKIQDYAKRLLKHEIITAVLILSEDEEGFTEFDLWEIATDKEDHGPDCDCDSDFVDAMKLLGDLATDAGGWWYRPVGERYDYEFMDVAGWTQMHKSWHLRREARNKAPTSKAKSKHHSN